MRKNTKREAGKFCANAYDDWFADIYDQWYPELLDETKGPYRPVRLLLDTFPELSGRDKSEIAILDCACGTGNSYIAFSRNGYNIWATDGSEKMLEHAAFNCKKFGVSNAQLVVEPIAWTNTEAYQQHFINKGTSFDLILINSNSLCHLPAVDGYLDIALNNFRDMLKPGGRLVIDTKRYSTADESGGVPIFRELRYVDTQWTLRAERSDGPRHIEGLGEVLFHTNLHYDVDPYFKVCRALVVVTIYGEGSPPLTRLLSYYPLPAERLKRWVDATGGFETTCFEAKTLPFDWSYDIVVARRHLDSPRRE